MPNQLVRCVEGQVCKSDDLQPRIVRSDESNRIRFFAHDLRVTLEAQLRDRAPGVADSDVEKERPVLHGIARVEKFRDAAMHGQTAEVEFFVGVVHYAALPLNGLGEFPGRHRNLGCGESCGETGRKCDKQMFHVFHGCSFKSFSIISAASSSRSGVYPTS